MNHFITEDIYLINHHVKSEEVRDVEVKYLILTSIPLADEDKEFLFKIFAAVNVSPVMLDLGGPESKLNDSHSGIFFFGIKPTTTQVEFYKEFNFQDRMAIMAHSLSEIANESANKRDLWSVLQTCFA